MSNLNNDPVESALSAAMEREESQLVGESPPGQEMALQSTDSEQPAYPQTEGKQTTTQTNTEPIPIIKPHISETFDKDYPAFATETEANADGLHNSTFSDFFTAPNKEISPTNKGSVSKMFKLEKSEIPKYAEAEFFDLIKSLVLAFKGAEFYKTPSPDNASVNLLIKAPSNKLLGLITEKLQPLFEEKCSFSMPVPKRQALLLLSVDSKVRSFKRANHAFLTFEHSANTVHIEGSRKSVDIMTDYLTSIIENIQKTELDTELVGEFPFVSELFVRGAFNANITKHNTDKVSVEICRFPEGDNPNSNQNFWVKIVGSEKDRKEASAFFKVILEKCNNNCQQIRIPMTKAQQEQLVRAKGLDKIIYNTGVAAHPVDNEIVMFGPSELIGDAIALTIDRSKNYVVFVINCGRWVFDLINSDESENCLKKLKSKYPLLWFSVSPLNSNSDTNGRATNKNNTESNTVQIQIDGPVAQVEPVKKLLLELIADLSAKNMHRKITLTESWCVLMFDLGFGGHCDFVVKKIAAATNTNIIVSNANECAKIFSHFSSALEKNDASKKNQQLLKLPNFVDIQIIGEKENLNEAYSLINELINELKTKSLTIQHEYNSLLFPFLTDKYLKNFSLSNLFNETFKNAHRVKYSVRTNRDKNTTTITLNGTRGPVEVLDHLICLLYEQAVANLQVKQVEVAQPYHAMLIGRNGTVKFAMEKQSGVNRIVFPTDSHEQADSVFIVGDEKSIAECEKLVNEKINAILESGGDFEIKNVVVKKEHMNSLFLNKSFLARRICVLANAEHSSKDQQQTSSQDSLNENKRALPKVQISVKNAEANTVKVQGDKSAVTAVVKFISDWQNKTVEVDSIEVDPALHKVVIGKGGKNINKLIDETVKLHGEGDKKTLLELVFPNVNFNENDTSDSNKDGNKKVFIVCRSRNNGTLVREIKNRINNYLKDINDFKEESMTVEKKFAEKMVTQNRKSGTTPLQTLKKNHPAVKIILPSNLRSKEEDSALDTSSSSTMNADEGSKPITIVVKGPSKLIAKVKKEITTLTTKWRNMHQVEVSLSEKEFFYMKNKFGKTVQALLMEKFDVETDVKFIKNMPTNIKISGIKESVDKSLAFIQQNTPVTETMLIKQQYHRQIIGTKGDTMKKLQEGLSVKMTFPSLKPDDKDKQKSEEKSEEEKSEVNPEEVVLFGVKADIETLKKRVETHVRTLIAKKEEWEKNNYSETIRDVKKEYLPRLIGKKASNIAYYKKTFNVQLIVEDGERKKGEVKPESPTNTTTKISVIIKGAEEQVKKAREQLSKTVYNWDNTVQEEMKMDKEIFRRIKGMKGANVTAVAKKNEVEINFTEKGKDGGEDSCATIFLKGLAKNIQAAREALKQMQEEAERKIQVEKQFEPPKDLFNNLENFQFTKT